MPSLLSTDLRDENAVPYFLWDDPMTVRQLKEYLARASECERFRMLGKILREARDTDVWRFTTPEEVERHWSELSPHLGRRRAFWRWLLDGWRKDGVLHG
jgi:hypothetical protein